MDDLGGDVIRAVRSTPYDWRTAQPYIESSNPLKRAVGAALGGGVRTEPQRWDLGLPAGELILTMAALRSCLGGKETRTASYSPGLSEVALFRPT